MIFLQGDITALGRRQRGSVSFVIPEGNLRLLLLLFALAFIRIAKR
jgi:hypothetical protein